MRDELLSAIKTNNDEDIEKALRALSEQNPTRAPAKSDKLFGKWKLLWASPNSEVAKATRRNPLPSYSEQLIGMHCAPVPHQPAMSLVLCCVRTGISVILQSKLQKGRYTCCIMHSIRGTIIYRYAQHSHQGSMLYVAGFMEKMWAL